MEAVVVLEAEPMVVVVDAVVDAVVAVRCSLPVAEVVVMVVEEAVEEAVVVEDVEDVSVQDLLLASNLPATKSPRAGLSVFPIQSPTAAMEKLLSTPAGAVVVLAPTPPASALVLSLRGLMIRPSQHLEFG